MSRTVFCTIMRLGSQRAPYKCLRKLGDRTLAEISMRLAMQAADIHGGQAIAVVREDPLVEIADKVGIEVVQPPAGSERSECPSIDIWPPLLKFMAQLCDQIILLTPCTPFLSVDTVLEAAARFPTDPFFTVFSTGLEVWARDVNNPMPLEADSDDWVLGNSKLGAPKYICNGSISGIPTRLMSGPAAMRQGLRLMVVPNSPEHLDLDTEQDWRAINTYWRGAGCPELPLMHWD